MKNFDEDFKIKEGTKSVFHRAYETSYFLKPKVGKKVVIFLVRFFQDFNETVT